ncbi:AAA family ATPase [Methylobacterium nodulans]|uniref:AAA family ATPase n=1 Tax=Methylobacterium nodulans TaxID=114616 RepID=UPI00068147D3|nr:helicase RepA family protein [Methylobacterium nodulans]
MTITAHDESSLRRDTEIERRGVVRTLEEWLPDIPAGGKLRCEAPFRESSSEAAFIALNDGGRPFIHDVGSGTTYWLDLVEYFFKDIDLDAPLPEAFLKSEAEAPIAVQPEPAAPPRRLKLISFDEAADTALGSSLKPLVKGLLDMGTLSVLYGKSGAGKTFVATSLAYHVARGLPWDGMRTTKVPVLYVAAEGGVGARRRASALKAKHGSCSDFHYVLSSVNLLKAGEDMADLIAAADEIPGLGLIVIDTLSRVMSGGDENSSVDMGGLVKNLDLIRHHTKAHVMVVHHSGKDQAKGARGHSLLRAALDTELEVADREITVQKQRDMDQSWSAQFDLEVIPLGHDEEGDLITSCVMCFVEGRKVVVGVPTDRESEILKALKLILATRPDPDTGVTVAELAHACGRGTDDKALDGLRSALKRMATKNLVAKTAAGRWLVGPISD